VTGVRTSRFSLLELIVVMLLLGGAMALAAPRMAGFFRGRHLDDDARRLWALTRHAQELAVAQALPISVWIDLEHHRYGLEAVPGFGYTVPPLTYDLSPDADVFVDDGTAAPSAVARLTWGADGSLTEDGVTAWVISDRRRPEDAWHLVRQTPLSTFTLTREAPE
jgi:type II secretory pathway pseudopilin PulG